jgi:hypothetical protein
MASPVPPSSTKPVIGSYTQLDISFQGKPRVLIAGYLVVTVII